MLDKEKIRKFWDAQAQKSNITHESISNLEENPCLAELKAQAEISKIMPLANNVLSANSSLLDLGGGSGQWAMRFSRLVKSVTLVEFSQGMLDLAKKLSLDENIDNIHFVHSEAQDFFSDDLFDVIWISGLLIYLEDDELEKLLTNSYNMLQTNGVILLRDGTGIGNSHRIENIYSESLKQNYSAFYRTASDYIQLFDKHGFINTYEDDMFPDGSTLNKWKETRLRVYQFKKLEN